MNGEMIGFDAALSPDGRYRYTLQRQWIGGGGCVCWVMLNPSTADATRNDATVRRCIGFSRRWRFDRLVVVNLYALRSRDPAALCLDADPIGPGNDEVIARAAREAELVVAAWGAHPVARWERRDELVCDRMPVGVRCLGTTAGGHPRHPLFVPGDREPVPLGRRAAAS